MTDYTITDDQIDELHGAADSCGDRKLAGLCAAAKLGNDAARETVSDYWHETYRGDAS